MESVLFDILLNVALGYVLARLLIWFVQRHLEAKLNSKLETLAERMVDEFLVLATVEVDNNQYFCYNTTTKEFVCQGNDFKEIADNFLARYPNKKLALLEGDKTALETLNQQMKQLQNENSNSVRSTS